MTIYIYIYSRFEVSSETPTKHIQITTACLGNYGGKTYG